MHLDRLLTTLDVRLHAFAVCNVAPGCRLVFEPMTTVIVHYVLEGSGVIECGRAQPVGFAPGSILIVPPDQGQALSAGAQPGTIDIAAGEHCLMVADGLVEFDAAGARKPELLTICATVAVTYGGSIGLFDGLGAPIVDPLDDDMAVRQAFRQLHAERSRPGIGTAAICESLMKLCFIVLLRRLIARGGAPDSRPALLTLDDPRLAAAVTAVLEAPGSAHDLVGLARAAGMSRSSFAKAFADRFAMTPMAFVQTTRLHHAARLLISTDLPVKVIAASTGFASRSHFSRAFSRAYGRDASRYRKLHRGELPDAPALDHAL